MQLNILECLETKNCKYYVLEILNLKCIEAKFNARTSVF